MLSTVFLLSPFPPRSFSPRGNAREEGNSLVRFMGRERAIILDLALSLSFLLVFPRGVAFEGQGGREGARKTRELLRLARESFRRSRDAPLSFFQDFFAATRKTRNRDSPRFHLLVSLSPSLLSFFVLLAKKHALTSAKNSSLPIFRTRDFPVIRASPFLPSFLLFSLRTSISRSSRWNKNTPRFRRTRVSTRVILQRNILPSRTLFLHHSPLPPFSRLLQPEARNVTKG